MCLITAAPKGTNKRGKDLESFIIQGMSSNTHGSGFGYKRKGQTLVNIDKGYTKDTDLIEAIDALKLTTDDELIIHHRIGTSGLRNEYNMHPFAVSENDSVLQTVKGSLNVPLMAHNGVFHSFTSHGSPFNDTYHFVQNFIAVPEITNLLMRDPAVFQKLFKGIISYNKLAFLFPKRDMVLLGDFTEDSGYFHSNDGYKKYVFDKGGSSGRSNTNDGLTDEEIMEHYGINYSRRESQPAGRDRQPAAQSCAIASAKNDFTENTSVNRQDVYSRFVKANFYDFPEKHISITHENAHHFLLVVNNSDIAHHVRVNDVLMLTDYDQMALVNWVTNLTNHNTMIYLDIAKALKNGDLTLYVKKELKLLYSGLYKLNDHLLVNCKGKMPKALYKNLAKSIESCQRKRKPNTDLIKFRDFGTIHLGNLKKIYESYTPKSSAVLKAVKSDESVITNSEIVEDTAS